MTHGHNAKETKMKKPMKMMGKKTGGMKKPMSKGSTSTMGKMGKGGMSGAFSKNTSIGGNKM